MSAYVVNNETISAIVKGFEVFNVEYRAEDYKEPVQILINLQKIRNSIGQSLLNQNYKSVNYRYNENSKTPEFKYKDVSINEGAILGCIDCYVYQAFDTSYFFESELYNSLMKLKNAMLIKLIEEKGQNIPWGYEF